MIFINQPPPFFIHPGWMVGDKIFDDDTPDPIAWTDLDISSKVGARTVLAMLAILNKEVGGSSVALAFRIEAAGNVETRAQGFPATCGGTVNCNLQNEVVPEGRSYCLIKTSSSGTFQWICDKVGYHIIMGIEAWLPIKDV